ncbi:MULTISPECIES: branched-chain amino acid ABC transporter permease [unclassified Janibacter]|uniref:branched-chain amino acid ABC transporter permease n=1 Tax=unclassified Janibacter TaxID=2649294 RepID=UPI003D009047
MKLLPDFSEETRVAQAPRARLLTAAGSVLLIVSAFLSWSFDDRVLDDISIRFYPASLQLFALFLGVTGLVLSLVELGVLSRLRRWLDATLGLRALGAWTLGFAVLSLVAIATETAGLVNVNEGGWVALVGALLLFVGATLLPQRELDDITRVKLPGWAEILVIVVSLAVALFAAAYALEHEDPWVFVLFLVTVAGIIVALARAGFFTWFGSVASRHRHVLTLSSFAVAFLFPFALGGSQATMSIAAAVLVFAATAIGLNIVVGLAGLLDLGYIAFLGAGAYVSAMLSASAFATIDWTPPFLVTMLIGGCVSAILGLIIGSPTLRVSGDYLAIVTLAFGEIFRLAMFNLDGNNGPDLTNGPNGIPAIPHLNMFGFDFGAEHTIAGVTLGADSNYYFLLLVLLSFIILVFTRLNNSRIGRGWVAIREDERAAEAMGVNTFGLKLLAFAGGAFLAGLAGTIKAHRDVAVSPDQYIFLESAFLLSAVVLGGMGTVAGVLVGAVILKLMPEKLRFFSEYRLLIFGLLLIVMMRFRPEGLVASKRRQLEFHDDDEELATATTMDELEAAK